MNKITVLMSCYNCSETVERAIESIISQSYQNWILFLCDDGSSDNTYEIIKMIGQANPKKIKIFKNRINKGLTYSLNKMLDNVESEFVARMDSDDIAKKSRFEKQIKFLLNNSNYSFCGTCIEKFDEEGIYCQTKYAEMPECKDFYWNNPFVHPSIMIKTQALRNVSGYRDIKKTIRCEDYDLWLRLYEYGYKGYNLQEFLLEYYEGRNSFNKRKFKYRINESKIRFEGYKKLKLFPKGYIYVLKPLFIGLLPGKLINRVKRN